MDFVGWIIALSALVVSGYIGWRANKLADQVECRQKAHAERAARAYALTAAGEVGSIWKRANGFRGGVQGYLRDPETPMGRAGLHVIGSLVSFSPATYLVDFGALGGLPESVRTTLVTFINEATETARIAGVLDQLNRLAPDSRGTVFLEVAKGLDEQLGKLIATGTPLEADLRIFGESQLPM